ncbi:hypothetical protein Salat_0640500 [Sesamum alatum]|uniref:Uncharacterized protein n=1 Tax=Sesamum alatum TaxID=300844 RepID=A0AAE1YRQ9_9LAMI|nr:hypothetical protein Salat_0640500 [Sesamum alatum]
MGNCIGGAFEKESSDVVDEELQIWTTVDEKFSSGGGCKRVPLSKLCMAQLPFTEMLIQQHSLQTPACRVVAEKVKIVVNKQQLKLLMGGKERMQLRRLVLHSLARNVNKWRPSLAVIPEL